MVPAVSFHPVTYEASEAQNPLTTERLQLGPPEKEEKEGTGYWIKVGLRQGTVSLLMGKMCAGRGGSYRRHEGKTISS